VGEATGDGFAPVEEDGVGDAGRGAGDEGRCSTAPDMTDGLLASGSSLYPIKPTSSATVTTVVAGNQRLDRRSLGPIASH
jgi:hypothetical protein